MHDIIGELRFAANRHAGALSQIRLYIADMDETGSPGEPTTDKKVSQLDRTIFGGATARAEMLRTMGVQLFIGGESYIVVESVADATSDRWYVVSARNVQRTDDRTSGIKVRRPQMFGGDWYTLNPKADLMMRVWTPHPDNFDLADSPTRAVLPILREIERLSMLTFSQIDSRLISAGLLLLPQNIEFPTKDGTNGGITELMQMILEVATAQLTGAGTAAGLVPILASIPPGTGTDIQHLKFESPLQAELTQKQDAAIKRLATGLDISPEEMLGMGRANHWGANQIDENSVKLFIMPVMQRICDALNQGYLYPALKSMGLDPEKYSVWFDAAALATRPNRFEDALKLHAEGVLSSQAVRRSGNFTEDDAGTPDEITQWRAWQVVTATAGAVLQDPNWAKLVGLPVWKPPAPPAPPTPPQPQTDRQSLDAGSTGDGGVSDTVPGTASGGASPAQEGLTAAGALVPGAEQAVLHALGVAGARLRDRRNRSQFADVPIHQLHTRVRPADREHARRLVDGAFPYVPSLAGAYGLEAAQLAHLLTEYCVELLVRGYAHETDYLRAALDAARTAPPELSRG